MGTSFQYSSLTEMQVKQNLNLIAKCTIKILNSVRMPRLGVMFVIIYWTKKQLDTKINFKKRKHNCDIGLFSIILSICTVTKQVLLKYNVGDSTGITGWQTGTNLRKYALCLTLFSLKVFMIARQCRLSFILALHRVCVF
jgi:hypothetical protein